MGALHGWKPPGKFFAILGKDSKRKSKEPGARERLAGRRSPRYGGTVLEFKRLQTKRVFRVSEAHCEGASPAYTDLALKVRSRQVQVRIRRERVS
jgi:hypothetical protein